MYILFWKCWRWKFCSYYMWKIKGK